MNDGLILHPDNEHIIYPLGTTLVVRHIISRTQQFLRVSFIFIVHIYCLGSRQRYLCHRSCKDWKIHSIRIENPHGLLGKLMTAILSSLPVTYSFMFPALNSKMINDLILLTYRLTLLSGTLIPSRWCTDSSCTKCLSRVFPSPRMSIISPL